MAKRKQVQRAQAERDPRAWLSESCASCVFWVRAQNTGTCRRFPGAKITVEKYVCAEWEAK